MAWITYGDIHRVLREVRGKASEYPCSAEGCPRQAEHWAYQHTAEFEYSRENGSFPYSASIEDYAPMCVSCHRSLDSAVQRDKRATFRSHTDPHTRQQIAEWLERGLSMAKIAAALNADRIPTSRGLAWTRFNVFRLVSLMRAEDERALRKPGYFQCRAMIETCQQSCLSARRIAAVLNDSGYRTILGNRWTERTVNSVLRSKTLDEAIAETRQRVCRDWLAEFGEDAMLPSQELNDRLDRAMEELMSS